LVQLFSDPALVTRQMLEDMLKFKRLEGVDQALRQLNAGCSMAGGSAWTCATWWAAAEPGDLGQRRRNHPGKSRPRAEAQVHPCRGRGIWCSWRRRSRSTN
jgi:hypothetical protein